MKTIEKHRLNNNWEYAKKLWVKYNILYNLRGWNLILNNMYDKIGVCDYQHKTISLSSIFMRGASCNYNKVKKSLLHEIAHALTPGSNHNHNWVNTCKKIGGDARLAATMDLPGMEWVMYCRVCGWRQESLARPNVDGKICMGCNKTPLVKYIK